MTINAVEAYELDKFSPEVSFPLAFRFPFRCEARLATGLERDGFRQNAMIREGREQMEFRKGLEHG